MEKNSEVYPAYYEYLAVGGEEGVGLRAVSCFVVACARRRSDSRSINMLKVSRMVLLIDRMVVLCQVANLVEN